MGKSEDDSFPPLREDTVFVAAPGDVTSLRAQIERIVRQLAEESSTYSHLRPYSWDLEFDPEGPGFEQRVSKQRQIPRPADPLCRGTICILSERIGSPQENDFPLHLLPEAQEWTDREQKYWLQHPWPQDAEAQNALLEKGGFPLTGTVWEFLDAHRAEKPVFLAFIANHRVDPEDPSIQFGRSLLYQAYAARGFHAHDEWVQRTYRPQIRALRNFAGAVIAKGIEPKTYATEEALIAAIRTFISTLVLRQPSEGRTPFKGLAHYDIEDGDVFYGRDLLSASVIRDIDDLAQNDQSGKAVGLIGVSGSGKSSALRAGVLYKLRMLAQRRRYHVMALRPTDFQDEQGNPHAIIQRILSSVVTSARLNPPSQRLAEAYGAPVDQAARAAVALIAGVLPPALDGEPSKLVIGLDQLEEIVDDLMEESSARSWRPLIEFLAEARKSGSILFVYTLEAARTDLIGKTPLAEFVDELLQHKVANGPEFWREILTRPFQTAGMSLGPPARKRLFDGIDVLTKDKRETEISALLPLVALTLSTIYIKAKDRKDRHDKRPGAARGFGETRQKFEVDLSDFRDDKFDIEKAIANQASDAVRDTWGVGPPDPDDLNYLLRPFVRFSEGAEEAITLRSAAIPKLSSERTIIEAFLQKRLVVKVDAQRCRLVHEAMLHHWAPAQQWLAKVRDELRIETAMRAQAEQWDRVGRKASVLKATKERIDLAADLLSNYLRPWVGGSEMIEGDQVLRDYSLALLKRSKVPSALVGSSAHGSTHAYLAACYGRVDVLKAFATLDIAALDGKRKGDHRTPLFGASWNQPEVVAFLLERGASATSRSTDSWRPIHFAIYGNNQATFDLLLPRYKKSQLLYGPQQTSVLHYCALNNRPEMARRLVEDRGISVNACQDGGTPLHWAALQGHLEIARELLDPTDVTLTDQWGQTPLHVAAAQGSGDMIDLLLSRYDPNATADSDVQGAHPRGSTALHVAAGTKKASVVKRLLADARTNPNAIDRDGNTPLALAIHEPTIRADLLEDERIDVWRVIRTDGPIPLALCMTERQWRLCQRMLQRAGPIDDTMQLDGYGLFKTALSNGAPPKLLHELTTALREQIDQPNARGLTPLMAAAEGGSLPAIELLSKEARADLRLASQEAGTALQVALKNHASLNVVEALWSGTASELLAIDKNGWTPLHVTAITSNDVAARWLLAHGATDLKSLTDRWGRKPEDLASPLWCHRVFDAAIAERSTSAGSWEHGLIWEPLDSVGRGLAQASIDLLTDQPKRSSRTQFEWAALPFYPPDKARILRLSDPGPLDLRAYYLVVSSPSTTELRCIRLDGNSVPIHGVNAEVPITLTPSVVCDYLRFFCFFVQGDEGPFLITESIEQPEIPPLSEQLRSELARHLRPARYHGWNDAHDAYRASALVYYGRALFFADFVIKPSGMIEMLTDQPVLTDLPEVIEAMIA
jgi:ankyrin repeat protein